MQEKTGSFGTFPTNLSNKRVENPSSSRGIAFSPNIQFWSAEENNFPSSEKTSAFSFPKYKYYLNMIQIIT